MVWVDAFGAILPYKIPESEPTSGFLSGTVGEFLKERGQSRLRQLIRTHTIVVIDMAPLAKTSIEHRNLQK